jgi:hypothetical protein
MNHLRRIFAAVAALAGAVLALATAPAAFARPLPPTDCCTSGAATGVTLSPGAACPAGRSPDRIGAAPAGAILACWTASGRHARPIPPPPEPRHHNQTGPRSDPTTSPAARTCHEQS